MSKKGAGTEKVRSDALDAVLAQIRKEFGDGAIMRLGEAEITRLSLIHI